MNDLAVVLFGKSVLGSVPRGLGVAIFVISTEEHAQREVLEVGQCNRIVYNCIIIAKSRFSLRVSWDVPHTCSKSSISASRNA